MTWVIYSCGEFLQYDYRGEFAYGALFKAINFASYKDAEDFFNKAYATGRIGPLNAVYQILSSDEVEIMRILES